MDRPQFVYVTYIGASPEKVWQSLTDGEFTRQYWGGRRLDSDWKEGSEVRYQIDPSKPAELLGKVLRAESPKVLSYTFRSEQNPTERLSRVTFEIKGMGWATQLTLTHDDFDSGSKTYDGIRNGWPGILANLKTLLETGKPLLTKWTEPPKR